MTVLSASTGPLSVRAIVVASCEAALSDDAADHDLGLVPERRDRPVLKIDHEDCRGEERRDDEEHRLRLAIGERRKTFISGGR